MFLSGSNPHTENKIGTNGIIANLHETDAESWKVRWREDGINKQRTFRRKIDALNLQAKLFNGEKNPVQMRAIRFEEFIEIWTRRHCEIKIEKSTAKDYGYKVSSSILP